MAANDRPRVALRRRSQSSSSSPACCWCSPRAAWGYERSRSETIAQGVVIGGVDVGGLDRAAAEARLERKLLDPLQEPIVVKRWKRQWQLSAREARISADIDGASSDAIARSRDGFFIGARRRAT